MQYQQPRRYSAAEAEEVFRAGDAHGIAEALISVSLQLPDREWTERWLIHFSTHPHADVRRAAALALGHLRPTARRSLASGRFRHHPPVGRSRTVRGGSRRDRRCEDVCR